jgi:Outer membrane protein beta-barrel domain
MKKTILLSVLIASNFICIGQSRFGVFAGPQTTFAKYTIDGVKQSIQHKPGFQAGFVLKIPFENQLFFTPSGFYSLKGYKVKFNRPSYPPDTTAINNNTTIHTLELALMLQFDMGKQPDHFFLKSGLSLDGQLYGKEKFNLKTGGTVSRKMVFSFGEYGYVGANLLVQIGFETKGGFMIFGQYTHGIGSINNADGGPQIKHRGIGISVGQYFGKKNSMPGIRKKE